MNQLYIYICSHISSLLHLPPSHPPQNEVLNLGFVSNFPQWKGGPGKERIHQHRETNKAYLLLPSFWAGGKHLSIEIKVSGSPSGAARVWISNTLWTRELSLPKTEDFALKMNPSPVLPLGCLVEENFKLLKINEPNSHIKDLEKEQQRTGSTRRK